MQIFYGICLILGLIGFILAVINLWFLASDVYGWTRARLQELRSVAFEAPTPLTPEQRKQIVNRLHAHGFEDHGSGQFSREL